MSKEKKNHEAITYDNLTFVKIDPYQPFHADSLTSADAVIIEFKSRDVVFSAINEIRSHNDEKVYLLPVFLWDTFGRMDDTIAALSDGIIPNLTNLDSASAITRNIRSKF